MTKPSESLDHNAERITQLARRQSARMARCSEIEVSGTPAINQAELEAVAIEVAGRERTYLRARSPVDPLGLLIVLHGMGIDSTVMARWTGLGARGSDAGFETVFPQALSGLWDDVGAGRIDGADDAAFIGELAARFSAARGGVVLAGLSNGAYFAERLARHGCLDVRGLALVAGTARVPSREAVPTPRQPCALLEIVGTADPNLRYTGGRPGGVTGWIARRRARRVLAGGVRDTVAPEQVAIDWATANGGGPQPATEQIKGADLRIEKLSWPTPRSTVELIKLAGGGHGWPGGPQYLPRLLIGRISRTFDATAAVLDFARRVVP